MAGLRQLGTERDILGECPTWDDRAQVLWWVDIRRPAIRRLDPVTGRFDSWDMPEMVGALALTEGLRAHPLECVDQVAPVTANLALPGAHLVIAACLLPVGRAGRRTVGFVYISGIRHIRSGISDPGCRDTPD